MDALVLASPDAAVAAVPHILGFAPEQSLVLIWTADERLLLTQRMDLDDQEDGPWAAEATAHGRLAGASGVILLAFRPRETGDELPGRRSVDALERRLGSQAIELVDALLVDGDRWWSYRCDDVCCPEAGRSVDGAIAEQVTAAFVVRGSAPFASRQELAASLEAGSEDPVDAQARPANVPLEEWRDAVLAGPVARLLGQDDLDTSDAAETLGALDDVRVRDTLLWHLVRHEDARRILGRLAVLLRSAKPGAVAPIATVTAIAAWICGDGARASIAIDRAFDDRPDYTLALLVERSLRHGLSATTWLAAMQELPFEACRHGVPDPDERTAAGHAAAAGDGAEDGESDDESDATEATAGMPVEPVPMDSGA